MLPSRISALPLGVGPYLADKAGAAVPASLISLSSYVALATLLVGLGLVIYGRPLPWRRRIEISNLTEGQLVDRRETVRGTITPVRQVQVLVLLNGLGYPQAAAEIVGNA
jgi:hypothetical protein